MVRLNRDGASFVSSRSYAANHDTHHDDSAANEIATFSRPFSSEQSMVQLSSIDVWSTGPTPVPVGPVVGKKEQKV